MECRPHAAPAAGAERVRDMNGQCALSATRRNDPPRGSFTIVEGVVTLDMPDTFCRGAPRYLTSRARESVSYDCAGPGGLTSLRRSISFPNPVRVRGRIR
jgi:hypothetical protein